MSRITAKSESEMSLESISSKTKDLAIDEVLKLMNTQNINQQVKNHSWGKMFVQPKKGESLLSWLIRQAWEFGLTPRNLLKSEREYWLQKENVSLELPKNWKWFETIDVLPLSPTFKYTLQQRGLTFGGNELQLNLSKWLNLSNSVKPTKRQISHYYYYTLRYCPVCWKDENSRYFKILWRLPFVAVCLEHGTELKELCSYCGEPLFEKGKRNQLLLDFKERWLKQCRNCNYSLVDDVAEENSDFARIQRNILNILQSDPDWSTPLGYLIFWHRLKKAIKHLKSKSFEICLHEMTKILKKPPIFNYPKYFSYKLRFEIARRTYAATLFLAGNSAAKLAKKLNINLSLIYTFARDLLEGKSCGEIAKSQFGYCGKYGLERAKSKLRAMKIKYERLPKAKDKVMEGIASACYRGEWAEFDIRSWNDLLRKTFQGINLERSIYTGEQGLKRAIDKLSMFKTIHKRLPRTKDRDMRGIINAAYRGEWIKFGIKTWNDLILKTFREVNHKMGVYVDEKGLRKAIVELEEFKSKMGRLPRVKDKGMSGIIDAIMRGEWISFGIKSWNDLLIKTFGRINHRMGVYKGEKGLKTAKGELMRFKRTQNRSPTAIDKGMGGIFSAISRGEWISFGIKSWNDLLIKTFGEVTYKVREYTGEQGLKRAIDELLMFKTIHKKLPRAYEKKFNGIHAALCRGDWIKFGIKTWNDILLKTFGEVNKYRGIYKGKKGLEKTMLKLKEFESKNGRIPKTNDKGMTNISNIIYQGEWTSFGIKSWNDLLMKTFGRTNRKQYVKTKST